MRLVDGTTEVARHRRSYGTGETIEDPAHLAGLLAVTRQANAHTSRDRLRVAVPATDTLFDRLATRGDALRPHVVRLLALLDDYGVAELTVAVAQALAQDALGAGSITHILETRRRRRGHTPPLPLALPDRPGVRDLDVQPQALETLACAMRSLRSSAVRGQLSRRRPNSRTASGAVSNAASPRPGSFVTGSLESPNLVCLFLCRSYVFRTGDWVIVSEGRTRVTPAVFAGLVVLLGSPHRRARGVAGPSLPTTPPVSPGDQYRGSPTQTPPPLAYSHAEVWQHPRLPSMHRCPAPSLLTSSTSWNAGQPPPTTKVCGFRLPQMGTLRLPPTMPRLLARSRPGRLAMLSRTRQQGSSDVSRR